MARWLARQGVALRVADSRDTPPGVERLRAEAPAAEIVTGPFADSLLDVVRLAISPGLDPRQPLVEAARARAFR
jgi:UDP-N-acetylmuramoylalanine--D-glutamate ligase